MVRNIIVLCCPHQCHTSLATISELALKYCLFYFYGFTVLPTLKPRLDSESEVLTPQVGSSVTLRCEARGIPAPEVTWYRNGLQLAARTGLKVEQHQLEIMGVQVNTLSSPSVGAILTALEELALISEGLRLTLF